MPCSREVRLNANDPGPILVAIQHAAPAQAINRIAAQPFQIVDAAIGAARKLGFHRLPKWCRPS